MATKANKILWWMLCISQLVYIQVVYTMPPSQDLQGVPDGIFPALLSVAIIIALGTIIYRRRALVLPIQSGQLDLNTKEGLAKAFTPFILNLVLSQAVAIYGLVLSIMSGEPGYTLGFVAAALVLMYIHRPTSIDLQPQMNCEGDGKRPPLVT